MKLNDVSYKEQEGFDVVLVEIGGTVGDIESLPFLEAIRQMRIELGSQRYFIYSFDIGSLYSQLRVKLKPNRRNIRLKNCVLLVFSPIF